MGDAQAVWTTTKTLDPWLKCMTGSRVRWSSVMAIHVTPSHREEYHVILDTWNGRSVYCNAATKEDAAEIIEGLMQKYSGHYD